LEARIFCFQRRYLSILKLSTSGKGSAEENYVTIAEVISPSENSGLVRGLGLGSATAIVAGAVIGSGVFLVAAEITRALPSPFLALVVWAVAGVLSMMGGLMVAELGAAFPGEGGPYLYFREAFSPLMGFLNGWTIALIIEPGSIGGCAIGVAHFSTYFFSLSPLGIKLVASSIVLGFTLINLIGLKAGAEVMDILTVLKILALIGIVVAGMILPAQVAAPFHSFSGGTVSSFGVALIAAFWAYDGWLNVSYIAGEIKNPQRNVPLALLIGIGTATLLYLATNWVYYRFLPIEMIAQSVFPAGAAAKAMGGEWAVRIMHIAVILSTLGCANAVILSGARVTYAMAADRVLPSVLAYVHPTFHVPSVALLVQMVLALALIATGSYAQLVTYVISAGFIFYGLTAVALIVLRYKQPNLHRPFRVPFYPWLPLVYLLFTILFLGNAVTSRPWESITGMGIVLLGLPVYYAMKFSERSKAHRE